MKKDKKKKLKGGRFEWNEGGPGGSVTNFAYDIVGTVLWTINSVESAMRVMSSVGNIKSDMGVAFDEKGAPNPNDINVSQL